MNDPDLFTTDVDAFDNLFQLKDLLCLRQSAVP